MHPNRFKCPYLGFGVGLRPVHYHHILDQQPQVDWFEIISENFMIEGGRPLYYLDRILERYPVVQHGVSLSIGSSDPLDWDYLKQLKKLTKRTKTPWVSDHLCFSQADGIRLHNLTPVPYHPVVATHIAQRVKIVQDFLEKPFLLENVSSYVDFKASTMTEWDFLTSVVEEANCGILLDVNNVYVSSVNNEFSCSDYLKGIPLDRVVQMHLAGYCDQEDYLFDSHDHPVHEPVWQFFREVVNVLKDCSILVEWDEQIPEFPVLWNEAQKARAIIQSNSKTAHV
ncbi:MAG: DUF692 domain-containing protein [Planctomycetota bacterium]